MKRLYKIANDDIYIPFLSDEENLQLNPNVKLPKKINTFQDVLENDSFIGKKIKTYIEDNFVGFNKYIHESGKSDDALFERIMNAITHFTNLRRIDNIISNMNSYYKQLDKDTRINELKEYIENNFKDTIKQLINQNKLNKKEISDPEMVSKLYDRIGDTIQLSQDFDVDVTNRSYCFLYINNEILYSDFGGKHYEIINKYLKDHSIKGYVDAGRYRDINQINKQYDTELPKDTAIAWGHIAKGVAYIETYQNVSLRKVIDALLLKSTFKKIYYYNFPQQKITRLAKKAQSSRK